jgi:sec-independent protein translocase protein TatA
MFGTDLLAPSHILLILVVALIVLGPKRLPEVGRSLGRGLRDFRSGLQGVQDEARGVFHDALDEPSQPPEDSAVSAVPEPIAPATAEPVVTPLAAREPAPASVTKVVPVDPDPAEFAD